jgi:hypothetical protein
MFTMSLSNFTRYDSSVTTKKLKGIHVGVTYNVQNFGLKRSCIPEELLPQNFRA